MSKGNFNSLHVLALESRRAREIAQLITNCGGEPLVAPSVREVPLESNEGALELVHKLSAGQVDMVIFMTGVGVRALVRVVEGDCPQAELATLLNRVMIVARGPKPVAALREMAVRVSVTVPEPNTWRDLLCMLDEKKDTFPLQGCRVAVQEYGVSNPELSAGLEQRGARVFPVCVYEWALPEDTAPLQAAVTSIIRGEVQVMLVASSVQIRHLFQVAESMACASALHDALAHVVIASIGPLTSEELRNRGLNVDLECSHPKMGFLVQETAEKSGQLFEQKKARTAARG
ncbi:MAG: uroporphyrinogen-III synthase [Candidatus Sulfotelmatobacter sp.]